MYGQQYNNPFFLMIFPFIILLVIFDGILKAIALWKAARNNQLGWFVAIIILNTAGILPLLYILAFQPKTKTPKKD